MLEIYSYVPTIPLAEALAIEARRAGSDTHITLMTDDLWFTSMQELPVRWLRSPSQAEIAINRAVTAYVYLGGPRDARRMRNIPPEKFDANAMGNIRQDKPRKRRNVRHVDLPIGRVCPERAEAYGLDYSLWQKSYYAALAVDLNEISRVGSDWERRLLSKRRIRVRSDAGTDLSLEVSGTRAMVDDGIIDQFDLRRGFVETSIPAGKVVKTVVPSSAEGEVHFTDPVFLMGRSVEALHLRFHKGRLIEWDAREGADLLKNQLGNPRMIKWIGWFSIGLNSAAEPCMLDNSIVQNDIGIGFGPHPLLERSKTNVAVQFEATIGRANLEL